MLGCQISCKIPPSAAVAAARFFLLPQRGAVRNAGTTGKEERRLGMPGPAVCINWKVAWLASLQGPLQEEEGKRCKHNRHLWLIKKIGLFTAFSCSLACLYLQVVLVPEIDSMRLVMSGRHELLRKVPAPLAEVRVCVCAKGTTQHFCHLDGSKGHISSLIDVIHFSSESDGDRLFLSKMVVNSKQRTHAFCSLTGRMLWIHCHFHPTHSTQKDDEHTL
eukprot:990201-Pelagomonas_calceolata.AAC.2